jgi:hypothetical protein
MAKATRIQFKGLSGTVHPNASGLYNTRPWLFVPEWVAGMPNQRAGIPLTDAEFKAASKPTPALRTITAWNALSAG